MNEGSRIRSIERGLCESISEDITLRETASYEFLCKFRHLRMS